MNWIDLGIERAKNSGEEAIFWLDSNRASDKIMIELVKNRLKEKGANLAILSPKEACLKSLAIIRAGKNTIRHECENAFYRAYAKRRSYV